MKKTKNPDSETMKKFKPPQNTQKNLLQRYFASNKNFRSPKFWLTNLLAIFLFCKTIQLFFFMQAFSYTIPKEQMRSNMISLNKAKGMKPDVLHKLLDDLERMKEERKKNI
jgi:hypothetical protein